ncbi:hypothetical protein [Pseudorhodoferax sp. Leaf267]|uniref:hypothetical protein n=1 Tax=Pseudorhodoferax sp. Leaf267 TaxID=1736316 RepID=UPI0006F3497B|nr:hypothetical protein [Pseudorhodoferax sp. Leaf267]KQP22489.1 hypothetical protein ASF43_00735 [Pseudorhodoferax sp. Leaf267]
MFTASVPPRSAIGTWAVIAGVLAIVALLWVFGAVVQGQVERAQARLSQPAPVQSAVVSGEEDTRPVSVAYR